MSDFFDDFMNVATISPAAGSAVINGFMCEYHFAHGRAGWGALHAFIALSFACLTVAAARGKLRFPWSLPDDDLTFNEIDVAWEVLPEQLAFTPKP